ncbi:MAG: hypothetical protein ACFHVJ_11590 [Aestuariibacter sp.]
MKKQIKHLSPHQNGKVFGILMAVATLPFLILMMLMMSFSAPQVGPDGNEVDFPYMMFALFPVMYLLFGYLSVLVGCYFYNLLNRFIGGFEFTIEDISNSAPNDSNE